MHAVALAAELGIRKVVIPRAADVFSAWGMLMSDLRRDYFVTRLVDLMADERRPDRRAARRADGDGARAVRDARGSRRSRCAFLRYGNLRYKNQEHSVEVLAARRPDRRRGCRGDRDPFHDAYEREYTYRLDAPVEFVGAHVVAIAEVGKLEPAPLPATGRRARRRARRDGARVDYATEGVHEAEIYDGELLEPGMASRGRRSSRRRAGRRSSTPATTVAVDDYGNLVIDRRGGA